MSNVTIGGSGDALQVNGSGYLTDCQITGDGDIILGCGSADAEFFRDTVQGELLTGLESQNGSSIGSAMA